MNLCTNMCITIFLFISPPPGQQLAEMVEEEKDSGGMMTSPENIRVAFPAAGATAKAAQQQVRVCALVRVVVREKVQ